MKKEHGTSERNSVVCRTLAHLYPWVSPLLQAECAHGATPDG